MSKLVGSWKEVEGPRGQTLAPVVLHFANLKAGSKGMPSVHMRKISGLGDRGGPIIQEGGCQTKDATQVDRGRRAGGLGKVHDAIDSDSQVRGCRRIEYMRITKSNDLLPG